MKTAGRFKYCKGEINLIWAGKSLQREELSTTDRYGKLKGDVTFRKKVAEQVGVGLELPAENVELAPNCTQSELSSDSGDELKSKRKNGSPG